MDLEALAKNYYSETESEEYTQFVEKFKPKKTTDDCYTPPEVYEAVKQWVLEEVSEIRGLRIVRPFYPGGNYQAEDYTGAVVIDNPPFSILAEIKRFYLERNIPFFLFAPALTLLSGGVDKLTAVVADCPINYENGAEVRTNFVSNLFGDTAVLLSSTLSARVREAMDIVKGRTKRKQPKYEYPSNVASGALLNKYTLRGLNLRIPRSEVHYVRRLDSRRERGKAIFGNGYLVSNRIAKILEEASTQQTIRNQASGAYCVWELSEREREIIKRLSNGAEDD